MTKKKTLVVIESPYAGAVERNLTYLRAALKDSLARNEAPYASHGLYAQPSVLDDTVPAERATGMEAGFAWGARADLVVLYLDLGWSSRMRVGLDRAVKAGQPLKARILGSPWSGMMPCDLWVVPRSRRCTSCNFLNEETVLEFGCVKCGALRRVA